MKKLNQLAVKFQIWKNTKGQDLIEYALMAGFVAVAAGAIVPGVATSMKNIFNKINSILASSAGT
jgi:pilus assembly protein Flp/PilA